MNSKVLFASALAMSLGFASIASAASKVTSVVNQLTAVPNAFKGKCPAVITFKGTITVQGTIDPKEPVQIGYTFLRSDGAKGPIAYYTIKAPGKQTVSSTWTLGGASLPTYGGWQQLKAWPTRHEGGFGYAFSPKVPFRVVCSK